jgi:hypothetical protein
MKSPIVALAILSVLFLGQQRLVAQSSDDTKAKGGEVTQPDKASQPEKGPGAEKKDEIKSQINSDINAERKELKEKAGGDPAKKDEINAKLEADKKEMKADAQEKLNDRQAAEGHGEGNGVKEEQKDRMKGELSKDIDAQREQMKKEALANPEKRDELKARFEQYKEQRRGEMTDHMKDKKSGNHQQGKNQQKGNKQKKAPEQATAVPK